MTNTKSESILKNIDLNKPAYNALVSRKEPAEMVQVNDAFSNPVARLGFGTQSLLESTQYPLTRLTQNYSLLNSLFRSSWVIQNIVTSIPEEIVKRWFNIQSKIKLSYIKEFERIVRKTQLRRSFLSGMKWGRLYGGAIGLILIRGHESFLDEPLDYRTILPGTFCGIYIADRWSGVYPTGDIITDVNDTEYGLPEFYEVMNEDGRPVFKVHHSRVIRFIGRELPFWERIQETYWGQSEVEAIYEEVVKRDNVSNNIANLTFKSNISVYEVDNLDSLLAIGSGPMQDRMFGTIQAQSVLESNMGVKLINKGDKVQNLQYGFAGLADIYSMIMTDVAGAARIPVTKLFGRSPTGLNATGESDLQNYYDYIDEVRETQFRPIIDKILPIIAISAWGAIPDDLQYDFDPIRTPSEMEKAEIAQRKSTTLIDVFNASGMTQEAFIKELSLLTRTTGMFSSISDHMIEQGRSVWINDLTGGTDPLFNEGGEIQVNENNQKERISQGMTNEGRENDPENWKMGEMTKL